MSINTVLSPLHFSLECLVPLENASLNSPRELCSAKTPYLCKAPRPLPLKWASTHTLMAPNQGNLSKRIQALKDTNTIHLFCKYLLRTYYVIGMVPDTSYTAVNKTDTHSTWNLHSSGWFAAVCHMAMQKFSHLSALRCVLFLRTWTVPSQ